MICRLKGRLIEKNESLAVLDVNGVGYQVFISQRTFGKIKDKEAVEFFTYMNVTEKSMDLYGFLSDDEKRFFETMIAVSGIGPKMALMILSGASVSKIKRAVLCDDVMFFVNLPGIGKKKAERFIIETRDKIDGLLPSKADTNLEDGDDVADAMQALGYSQRESIQVARDLPNDLKNTKDRVAWALKNIGNYN